MSKHRHHSEDALDRIEYLDLYRGATRIKDEYKKKVAILLVLCTGRLKMRIGEAMHLHEGWIYWRNGYIQIPAFEPCGCGYCWNRAEKNFDPEEYDDDDYVEFFYRRRWKPKSESGARTVPFNWSNRVTAALGMYFDEYDVVDENYQWCRRLLNDHILENTEHLEPGDVKWHALRATGETFWADQGLDDKALRDLGGWARLDENKVYEKKSADQLTNKMREAVGKPPLSAVGTDFVALDPRPFINEGFDPRDPDPLRHYDPYKKGPVLNPREPNPPADIEFEPHRFDSLAVERDPPSASQRRAFVRRADGERIGDGDDVEATDPYFEALDRADDDPFPGQSRLSELSEFRDDESGMAHPRAMVKMAYYACVVLVSWSLTFSTLG